MKKNTETFTKRISIVYVIILLFGATCIYRLVRLQLVDTQSYRELADGQYVQSTPNKLDRGTIFFQKKDGSRVSAATIRHGYKLYIDPRKIEDAEGVYAKISKVLPSIDRASFLKSASKKNDPYEEISRYLSIEMKEEIEEFDLVGVHVANDQWRYYPAKSTAAHVLGFMGYDNEAEAFTGRYGLEKYYEDTLGRAKDDLYVNLFAQIFTDVEGALQEPEEREGDLITTIEPEVQAFLDERVLELNNTWKGAHAGAIIMDPRSGAIRGMSSSLGFDLNNFGAVKDGSVYTNPHVQHTYEMGSIMKPLIMAMGFNEGVVSPNTWYEDKGSVTVGKHTIYNYDKRARGKVQLKDVLAQSLNTGMVYTMKRMKKSIVRRYFDSLHIAEPTGVDLPYERDGLVSNLESNRDIEFANVSFGQGIAITPLAMLRALGSLANNGKIAQPYIVEKIRFSGGLARSLDRAPQEKVFSEDSVKDVTDILVSIVDENFKKKYPALEHYSLAAKTGTAQVAHPKGGYYSDRNLHSFFGYAPAYDPQFIVLYFIMHPKGVRYSSETLSEPFMDTAQFMVNYYDIPPDKIRVE